jgi:CubicO group peptidase (beta-lactamase class C family)
MPLNPAFEHQDKVFSTAFSILQSAIDAHAFPAASVAVTHRGNIIALKSLGTVVYGNENAGAPLLASFARSGDFDFQVTPTTLFDLASLTKVVATTPMAMILYERGLLDLDAPVCAIVPEFTADAAKDPRRKEVTIRQLLTHSSGLPAYEKLFLRTSTRDELLRAAFTTPLAADPATRAEYSDIGFIILGVALERLADEPIDRFCQREIFAPLAMTQTTFNPPADLRPKIPPTADERDEQLVVAMLPAVGGQQCPPHTSASPDLRSTFRQKNIQGEVQDENAYILGGVAAHAGLFSSALDLGKFAHAILQCGAGAPAREMSAAESTPSGNQTTLRTALRLFHPETIALFTRRESAPAGTSRALGWDTPSAPSQSGKYFSTQSYGHLGYTGTSLWIDPVRQLSITLLTNRTWPDCSNQSIKQVRPKVHDAIIEALN